MNDFTKNIAQALFNQDKINDLLRKELQQAVNDLLEAELTAFLGYDPYARAGWNTGNSGNELQRTLFQSNPQRLWS
ncbi:transposase, partial [Lactobacillus iners]|uniref:transposase n=1 Tax=Lactobacillus iners TaxID=147802 RepID=UPI00254CB5C5